MTLARVPEGVEMPTEVIQLLNWIESQGFLTRGVDGEFYGSLTNRNHGLGTSVAFHEMALTQERIDYLGIPCEGLVLWPFCETGADGSQAALWRDGDSHTRIVHLGSGSGSPLTCLLGETPVDFLRLLAIGYDEICWQEDWNAPPERTEEHEPINQPYRDWVVSTFGVTIPQTATELIPHPSDVGDQDTTDPWCRFCNEAINKQPGD